MSNDLQPISSHDEYLLLLEEAITLLKLDPKPGTEESRRLIVLSDSIEEYEKRMYGF